MKIDVAVRSEIEATSRVKQLSAMFDVPPAEATAIEWHGDIPIDDPAFAWNVGLIVGPSGSGKTTVKRQIFGDDTRFEWGRKAVVDDFPAHYGITDIAEVCSAVGFNTIPAWMRPHAVLSNGEQFRVDLARHLLEGAGKPGPIVVDEFTSVVDRQVAGIASAAVAKYIRKHNRQFVGVTCHYDVIDWLQPDWVLHLPDLRLERRLVQRRPSLCGRIERIPYSAWRVFAPFHYMSAELHRAARCYGLFVDGHAQPVAFLGVMHRPHPKVDNIYGISRNVVLPDWQGIGISVYFNDTLASIYRAVGRRINVYPAHPAAVHGCARSVNWKLVKKPGVYSERSGSRRNSTSGMPDLGGRPCATFAYVGPAFADPEHAARIIGCPHISTHGVTRDPAAIAAAANKPLRRLPRGKIFA